MIPKNILIDFDSLKVGDKLWDIITGETIVIKITETGYIFCENSKVYYNDGRHLSKDLYPSLYLSNPFDLISEYPKEMWVKDSEDDKWLKRAIVYSNKYGFFGGNGAITIEDLKESHKLMCWKYAKDIEPESTLEISMDEAIEELSKLKGKQVIIK